MSYVIHRSYSSLDTREKEKFPNKHTQNWYSPVYGFTNLRSAIKYKTYTAAKVIKEELKPLYRDCIFRIYWR